MKDMLQGFFEGMAYCFGLFAIICIIAIVVGFIGSCF